MGSFWGHIDEGIFFIIISLWWTFQACWQYLKARQNGQEMKPGMSYSIKCRKEIPVETIFKFLFPLGGFLAEFLDTGTAMLDEDGNFKKLVNAQHMTIYGLFILHAIIDLLTWSGVPVAPGADRVSLALSFAWYGIAFYYHSQMHGKEPLETIVHVIPIGVMLVTAGSALLESRWQSGVWTLLTRAYCVLTLGTWFSHVPFMLYVHDSFPGRASSGWDRSDIRNVQYARACFGLHLLFNMLLMLLCYLVTYVAFGMRHKAHVPVMYYAESGNVISLHDTAMKDKRDRDDASLLLEDAS